MNESKQMNSTHIILKLHSYYFKTPLIWLDLQCCLELGIKINHVKKKKKR